MNSFEKDIIDYTFSEEKQKFISGRCAKSILEKRNWYNYLINKYNDNSTGSLIEVLYRIKYGIDEIPKCKICGKPLKFTNGSYPNYCSAKCRNNDPNVIAKNKEGYKDLNRILSYSNIDGIYYKNKGGVFWSYDEGQCGSADALYIQKCIAITQYSKTEALGIIPQKYDD